MELSHTVETPAFKYSFTQQDVKYIRDQPGYCLSPEFIPYDQTHIEFEAYELTLSHKPEGLVK